MNADLYTVLGVRLCVDAVVVWTFWSLHRRHRQVGGPAWWVLAGGFSLLATLSLLMRSIWPELVSRDIASSALALSVFASWLGLRSYLGLAIRRWWLWGAALVLLPVNLLLFDRPYDLLGRQLLFVLVALPLAVLALRDMRQPLHDAQRAALQPLKHLTLLEGAALLGYLVLALSTASGAPKLAGEPLNALPFLAAMADMLCRIVIYVSLITAWLQRDADRARRVLLARETDLRALIDNIHAGVIVFRPDQSIVTINSVARGFFGLSGSSADASVESVSADWLMLDEDGQLLGRCDRLFDRVLSTGQAQCDVVQGIRIPNPRASNEETPVRWALFNAFPENDAHGGLRHVVLTFVDITSLKTAQQQRQALETQLAQSHKMEALGTLAGGVAHDFNNILAAILGNAALARQDIAPGAPARQSLHEISAAARRGRELVRQILAFSRQQPLQPRPVGMRSVLAESCNLLRAAMPPQVQLIKDLGEGNPVVMADPTQMGQVLLNLGTNAVHALRDQAGQVEVRLTTLEMNDRSLPAEVADLCQARGVQAVRVQVQDNGSGMDEATRARMFEPFFTTKAVGRGTGLGLPVVLGIVQSHEGAIRVDSTKGQGTTFSLYFPAAAKGLVPQPSELGTLLQDLDDESNGPPAPAQLAHPAAPSLGTAMSDSAPKHILYLDDDDTLVFLVRRLLERRGHKVTGFTDQQSAIDALRDDPSGFDLLMTDFNMPGMSGLDVAREVLKIRPNLVVAVASGYITDELQAQARQAGVKEVVFKTDAVEDFCDVVARLLGGA